MKKGLGILVMGVLLTLPVLISYAEGVEETLPPAVPLVSGSGTSVNSPLTATTTVNEAVLSESDALDATTDAELPEPVKKELAELRAVTERLKDEEKLYGTVKSTWGVNVRGELKSRQQEGTSEPRDNIEVSKLQLIPYFIVQNLTPHFNLRVHATLNFEGRLNDRIDNRDPDKPKDAATNNGVILRPDKDFLEAAVLALYWNIKLPRDRKAVLVVEAGKGKIHVGDFNNSKFLDYSALEAFNVDQTGYVGVQFAVDDRLNVILEVFNLYEEGAKQLGKSFNLCAEGVLVRDATKVVKVHVAGTHNEPDFDNPNDLVLLSADQNQYSVGGSVTLLNIGTATLQWIYRDNENAQLRDDQGFSVTFDRELKEYLAGLFGMVKYEYLDVLESRNPLLGKHQLSLGTRYYLDANRVWSVASEVFQTSNGNDPIDFSGDEKTGAKVGFSLGF